MFFTAATSPISAALASPSASPSPSPPPVRPSDALGADYKDGAVDGGAVAAGVLVALVVVGGAVGGALLWRRRQRRLDTFLLDGNFDDKEDRLRLEFKASDRHSRGELHSSQI